MKTKNVKVSKNDLKHGVTIYVAHPVYGIDYHFVLSKPYMIYTCKDHRQPVAGANKMPLGVAVNTRQIFSDFILEDSLVFLSTAGISNGITVGCGRRTFFKLKHAEAWVKKWCKDPTFIKKQNQHELWCQELSEELDYDD